jgi:hypothetical protein
MPHLKDLGVGVDDPLLGNAIGLRRVPRDSVVVP